MRLLRRLGHEVTFDPRQTCCGQPAFNTGYRDHARDLARRFLDVFEGAEAVVAPSGSCVAMVRHFPELFADEPRELSRARDLAERVHELSSFLVDVLGVTDVGAQFDGRVTWHDACHGRRDLGVCAQPRALLQQVEGVSLVEAADCEACCGFGGTFSVKYPEISVAILDRKLDEIDGLDVEAVVSSDVSCLMHIDGRLKRRGAKTRAMHLAELLASRRNGEP